LLTDFLIGRKLSFVLRASTNEEPDSRAVSAKAAAGLPQSKEFFHASTIFWQGAGLVRIVF
jgi:hypothetical protein